MKKRSELAASNAGTPTWGPGLACSVFSREAKASNSARPDSRGTTSSSHCSRNSTGTVIRAAASVRDSPPARPKTAAVILGSAATNGTPIPLPIDTPQNPTGPPAPTQSSFWSASRVASHSGTARAAIAALRREICGPRAHPRHPLPDDGHGPLVLLGFRLVAVPGRVNGRDREAAGHVAVGAGHQALGLFVVAAAMAQQHQREATGGIGG